MDNPNTQTFLLPTDWMFSEPIDSEHKKYVLLSYFQKIDQLISQNKLYPHFIELSLHMANIHTLVKENTILYTNKIFKSPDDELLLKELLAKPVPGLSEDELNEVKNILLYSSNKFFEYFQIVKSYWTIFYETISISVKRNKSNSDSVVGYFYFNSKDNTLYVWEYSIDTQNPEHVTTTNLIYCDKKGGMTIPKIVLNNSTIENQDLKKLPVFEMKTQEDYPINETLLPLFKRKLLSYVFQKHSIGHLKRIEN